MAPPRPKSYAQRRRLATNLTRTQQAITALTGSSEGSLKNEGGADTMVEIDLKALAAGLATAAFFSFAAHAHQATVQVPDACSKAASSAEKRCSPPLTKQAD
jgi:hypothetical protein